MKKENLIGKEFKWISTLTGGETFGIIERILNVSHSPKIESTNKNCYHLKECTIKINDEFIKIEKIEN